MTPRSMAMARRLIFWYLLTLQNSVMQTVKSANAPYCTMAWKWSLFNLVTISNAELATRSVKKYAHLWFWKNWIFHQDTYLSGPLKLPKTHQTSYANQIGDFVFGLGSFVVNIVKPGGRRLFLTPMKLTECVPGPEYLGFDCGSWYIRRVSRSPFGTWNVAALPSLKSA